MDRNPKGIKKRVLKRVPPKNYMEKDRLEMLIIYLNFVYYRFYVRIFGHKKHGKLGAFALKNNEITPEKYNK